MRFISFLLSLTCLHLACGQINFNDTHKLKSYIRFLAKEKKYTSAASESETLYKLTQNTSHAYQSIKYLLTADSWQQAYHTSQVLLGEKDMTLQSQLKIVLNPTIDVPQDSDSQYYQFIQGLIHTPQSVQVIDDKLAELYDLKDLNTILKSQKKKRLIAGMASLVPGLGKLYIGRNMDALASFVNVSMLSGLSLASYSHLGLHPVTYITAGMAVGFYIAGLVGTQASIGTNRRMAHQKLKQYALDNYKLFLLSQ